MAKGKSDLVRLNFTIPYGHWGKIQTLGSLTSGSITTSSILSLAIESMAKVTATMTPDEFDAIARKRKSGENWIHVTGYFTQSASQTLQAETERLGTTKSTYVTTALAATIQEINLAALYALKLSFLQWYQRWSNDVDMRNSSIKLNRHDEPYVAHCVSRVRHLRDIPEREEDLTEGQKRYRTRKLKDTMRSVGRPLEDSTAQ